MTSAAEGAPAPVRWEPELGEHLQALLVSSGLDAGQSSEVASSTRRILARCRPPEWGAAGGHAQLVVGQVQSGKTLSFTSLIAAARDNAYPLVVVLAGTKNNLRRQTAARLVADLGMAGDGDVPPWRCIENPAVNHLDEVRRTLSTWLTARDRRFKQTTVLVVLKHSGRISAAADLLDAIGQDTGLYALPCLIVDDEADQAGLNTRVRQGEESTTYRAIKRLRGACANHTLVQYTATPQAPLLLSLQDALSPKSVTVLEPGSDYVGGADLFGRSSTSFVRHITPADLNIALAPQSVEPPASLVDAISYFLLACAVAVEMGRPRPLSMLIHPSAKTDLHTTYERWVNRVLDRVRLGLESGEDAVVQELVVSLLQQPYAELAAANAHVKPDGGHVSMSDVIDSLTNRLPYLKVRVVNSAGGEELDASEWNSAPGWVVIGGNKLDRGFTIKNLAVTYMPRGPGVNNADTIQQRGRFFGYKRSYLSLLRGWINEDTARSYSQYVDHEEAMRSELKRLDDDDMPLASWRRRFLLSSDLRPTRQQVISLQTTNHHLREGWAFTQLGLYGTDLLRPNTAHLARWQTFLEAGTASPDDTRARRNVATRIPLETVLEVLSEWAAVPREREALDALCFAFTQVLDEDPTATTAVYLMDGGRPRGRGLTARAEQEYLQGRGGRVLGADVVLDDLAIAALRQGRGGAFGYPGDDHFHAADVLTVQVHVVQPQLPGSATLTPTPALTLRVPAAYRNRVILQSDQT